MGRIFCAIFTVAVLCGTAGANDGNSTVSEESENTIIVAKAGAKTCPYCGEENLPEAVWCWKCGKKLPQENVGTIYCPYCGARISSTAKYCPECGRAVTKDQPARTESYRRKGPGPTGQSGLGVGLGAGFGGGSTALNFNTSFDFSIGDYVAFGPIIHSATAFNDLGVSYGAGVGSRFYLIPHFNSPVQPYVSAAAGYARGKALTIFGDIIDANAIMADFGFGTDFEIPGSVIIPFIGGGGGVNYVWASAYGTHDSTTEGVFGIGGGIRFCVW
jgi:predicted RNA-binding Zn-ribbon protein involved in translation (DUF1610 family)